MNGHGVDRHLLGLRVCMRPEESAEIFKDPAYARSSTFELSTSGLTPGPYIAAGFGATSETGYGINYMIGAKEIKMGMESKKSCKETDTSRFAREVTNSFRDVQKVCGAAANETSKL